MIWHWYVSRDNEIFIDIDRYVESIDLCRKRLQAGINFKALQIKQIYQTETSENHRHIIIVLKNTMPPIQRIAWAIALHSDIYRGICTMMRVDLEIPAPDVLIGKQIYHRLPEAQCDCDIPKHSSETMKDCHAAKLLRGEYRSAYFFGRKTSEKSTLL